MTATRFMCGPWAAMLNALGIGLILGGDPGLTMAGEEPNASAASGRSEWGYLDSKGRLVYKALETGDRIMDFSFAGYMGGGVAIPSVPAKVTLSPSGADDTAAIQKAIEAVSKMELVDGFRGAVLLKPGIYNCSRTLTLAVSGVVLRGSGSGTNGTTLKMVGEPHLCLSLAGAGQLQRLGRPVAITDAYVPSGTTTFHVEKDSNLKAGELILVSRPVTAPWVHFMGMDTLVRDGRKETWLGAGGQIESERVIKEIAGNQVILDIPLADSIDAQYLNPPGGAVVRAAIFGRISQVGVENLRIVAPAQVVEIAQKHNQAIRMKDLTDAWLRDIAIEDTVDSVGIGSGTRRVTVEGVTIRHSVATKGAAKPADFAAEGSQILFNRCSAVGDNVFYFVTQARVSGPNVLLHCSFHGNGHIQPHARWATGLLVDNCQVPESGIDFMNRGEMGSGHGWTIGWAVAWNCLARSYVIQQPPGAANWAIGCRGARETSGMPFGHQPKLPEGIFDSHGTPVSPVSLYLAQLRQRLGPQALKDIGY